MSVIRLMSACYPGFISAGSEVSQHRVFVGYDRPRRPRSRKIGVCAVNSGNGDSGASSRESVEREQNAQTLGEARAGRLFGEDSQFLEGPLETVRPRFSREIPDSVPLKQPVISSSELKKRRGRRRGPFKKPEPAQAVTGAAIAAVCTWLVYEGALRAYSYVAENPPASADLPLNLTEEVNSLALSFVVFLGGMSVALFGSATLGLLLLAGSILYKGPAPPKT